MDPIVGNGKYTYKVDETWQRAPEWLEVKDDPLMRQTFVNLVLGETYNDQPAGPVGLQVPGFTDGDAAVYNQNAIFDRRPKSRAQRIVIIPTALN